MLNYLTITLQYWAHHPPGHVAIKIVEMREDRYGNVRETDSIYISFAIPGGEEATLNMYGSNYQEITWVEEKSLDDFKRALGKDNLELFVNPPQFNETMIEDADWFDKCVFAFRQMIFLITHPYNLFFKNCAHAASEAMRAASASQGAFHYPRPGLRPAVVVGEAIDRAIQRPAYMFGEENGKIRVRNGTNISTSELAEELLKTAGDIMNYEQQRKKINSFIKDFVGIFNAIAAHWRSSSYTDVSQVDAVESIEKEQDLDLFAFSIEEFAQMSETVSVAVKPYFNAFFDLLPEDILYQAKIKNVLKRSEEVQETLKKRKEEADGDVRISLERAIEEARVLNENTRRIMDECFQCVFVVDDKVKLEEMEGRGFLLSGKKLFFYDKVNAEFYQEIELGEYGLGQIEELFEQDHITLCNGIKPLNLDLEQQAGISLITNFSPPSKKSLFEKKFNDERLLSRDKTQNMRDYPEFKGILDFLWRLCLHLLNLKPLFFKTTAEKVCLDGLEEAVTTQPVSR